MPATYVTEAELREALGIGDLYPDANLESVCQAAEDLIKKKLWFNEYPVTGCAINSGTVTLVLSGVPSFGVGQSVTITNVGAKFNGNHTITGSWPWTQGSSTFPWLPFLPWTTFNFPRGYSMIQYTASDHPADQNYYQVQPYGKASISAGSPDYAAEPLINQAALMIAIDIWQARQQSNAGGISPDGSFTPSPYRMGASLLSRVSGLIADFRSPRSMLG